MADLRSYLPPAPLPWRIILALDDDGSALAAELRAQQWAVFTAKLPVAMLAMFALATTLLDNFLRSGPAAPAVLWFAAFILVAGGLGALGCRAARRRLGQPVGASALRRIALGSGAAALTFNSITLIELAGGAQLPNLYAICSTQLALLACGAFLFSSAPLAGLLVVATLLAAYGGTVVWLAAVGVVTSSAAILPLILLAVVSRAVLAMAAERAEKVRQVLDMRARGDVIAMLLRGFEQNSRDWLFEMDAQGRLKSTSPRFFEMTGLTEAEVIGAGPEDPVWRDSGMATTPEFTAAIASQRAFRQIVVPVTLGGDARWWSISGSPRLDGQGQFAGFICVGSDITEERRTQEQIERMATSDGLTGLANRSVMRGALQAALDRASAGGGECALLLFDLDRFKAVNDTLGHQSGDELLREASRRFVALAGAGATCARLGGDEFAVVLYAGECNALATAERLIAALSEPFRLRTAEARVGASAGIAIGPAHGRTIDDLIRCADIALYEAKRTGRGVAKAFDPLMQARAEQRSALETALRSALQEDQLSLAFQPIYSLASGEVRAFEALLRWRHPELGPVSPAEFIPLAEEIGLITCIGEWVIRTACAWAARWPDHIGIAVNLSPKQLVDPKLPAVVLNALAAQGVAPHRLELEITENVFLNEGETTRAALAQLAALGVRLGLDDFGTGYSSLGYLRNSIFDTIKIDRSFVRDAVVAGSQSAEIVRHIVSLANNLGMDTVAEGAETEDELDTVRQLGCGNVQGFLMGRPMAPEAATALVSAAEIAQAA